MRIWIKMPKHPCAVAEAILFLALAMQRLSATAFLHRSMPFPHHGQRTMSDDSFSNKIQASRYMDAFSPSVRVFENEEINLNIYYRVYNPESMQDIISMDGMDGKELKNKRPLVVLHGGPSLPSQYLYSIADNIPNDRSIVFYDQIGCGRSSEPNNLEFYSIEKSVDDLEGLLNKLNIQEFHLLGHSYGGVLGYEYTRRISERDRNGNIGNNAPKCLSVTLANTFTSMEKADKEWDKMVIECALDDSLSGSTPNDRFFQRNLCRLKKMPPELSSSFENAGKVWFGTDVVIEWSASVIASEYREYLPSFMLITGEYDFVTKDCTSGWKDILQEALVKEEMMKDCSHYVHLENPSLFGSIVEEFCYSQE